MTWNTISQGSVKCLDCPKCQVFIRTVVQSQLPIPPRLITDKQSNEEITKEKSYAGKKS